MTIRPQDTNFFRVPTVDRKHMKSVTTIDSQALSDFLSRHRSVHNHLAERRNTLNNDFLVLYSILFQKVLLLYQAFRVRPAHSTESTALAFVFCKDFSLAL